MKKSFFIFILFFILFSKLFAQKEDDSYIWNKTSVSMGISEKTSLKISLKTHYLLTESMMNTTYLDLNLGKKITDLVKLGVAFRTAGYYTKADEIYELRPQAYVGLTSTKNGIKCQTTNRIAYRMFNSKKGHFRYYNNLFIYFPAISFLPSTYIGEEFFVKLKDEGLHLSRFFGGINLLKNGWIKMDVFYGLQKQKNISWEKADIMGLNMAFSI